jgi:hypothetical protein
MAEVGANVEQERQIRQLPPAAEAQVQLPPQVTAGTPLAGMASADPKVLDLVKNIMSDRGQSSRAANQLSFDREKLAAEAGKKREDEPLKAARASLSNLHSVVAEYDAGKVNPDHFGYMGKGKKLWEETMPGTKPDSKRVIAQAKVAGAAAAVRKELTGVAMSPLEAQLVEPYAPQPGDKIEVAYGKLRTMERNASIIVKSREEGRTLTEQEVTDLLDNPVVGSIKGDEKFMPPKGGLDLTGKSSKERDDAIRKTLGLGPGVKILGIRKRQ